MRDKIRWGHSEDNHRLTLAWLVVYPTSKGGFCLIQAATSTDTCYCVSLGTAQVGKLVERKDVQRRLRLSSKWKLSQLPLTEEGAQPWILASQGGSGQGAQGTRDRGGVGGGYSPFSAAVCWGREWRMRASRQSAAVCLIHLDIDMAEPALRSSWKLAK